MSNNKLGRGFDSLIPKNFDDSILATPGEKITQIKVEKLSANPQQPRTHFDEKELNGLSESIKQHGVLQPIVATPNGDEYYIIAGERRWRASKKAGIKTVPVIVRSSEVLERLELALVENVQRVNLSPLEQSASISHLHDQFNLDWDVIAKKLGKATTTVINSARLMQLPNEAKQALRDKKITEGHARSILALKDKSTQKELLDLIVKNSWSVRQAESFVIANRDGASTVVQAKKKVSTTTPETKKLAQLLNTKVNVRRMANGGKLEIVFKDDEDLSRITNLFEKNT